MDLAQPFSERASIPGASATCYNSLAAGITPSTPTDAWYLFYELKNLLTGRGEIGASVSFDQGASGAKGWQNVGTVLRETYAPSSSGKREVLHLSYPLVVLSEGLKSTHSPELSGRGSSTEFVMIPETNLLREVRIYTTCACCFPFSWSHAETKLRGEKFVDTAVVYSAEQERWFIFTSVEYELRLYMTASGRYQRSLQDAEWILHPSSPLYPTGSRHFGRNGGRIFPYGGAGFIRPSQDCSNFYGEQVHLHLITTLTTTEFKEEWVRSIKPSGLKEWSEKNMQGLLGRSTAGQISRTEAPYFASRLHHFDAHYIPEHSSGAEKVVIPARWIFVLDGDELPDDYQFWLREGWLMWFKTIVLLLVATFTILTLRSNGFAMKYCVRPVQILLAKRVGIMHWLKSLAFQCRLALYRVLLPSDQIAAPSNMLLLWCFFRRGVQLSVAVLVSLAFALWITARYPFIMSGPAGAHSAFGIDVRGMGYANLALKSQAYTEAHIWTQSLASEFGTAENAADSPGAQEHPIPLRGGPPKEPGHDIKSAIVSYDGRVVETMVLRAGTVDVSRSFAESCPPTIIGAFRALSEKDTIWAKELAAAPPAAATSPHHPISPPRIAPRIVILTSATSLQFLALLNLLASIQFWFHVAPRGKHWSNGRSRPAYEIVVLDLGLLEAQREKLKCVRYVSVRSWAQVVEHAIALDAVNPVPAADATGHTDEFIAASRKVALAVGGWHPLFIRQALDDSTVENGDALIWIAPEMEVRGSLADLTSSLFRKGVFAVAFPSDRNAESNLHRAAAFNSGRVDATQSDRSARIHSIAANTHAELLLVLGLKSRGILAETPLCSAGQNGVLGFVKGSAVADRIVNASMYWTQRTGVLWPHNGGITTGPGRHTFETGLWSALLFKEGFVCSEATALAYFAPPALLCSDPTLLSVLPLSPPSPPPSPRVPPLTNREGSSVVLAYRGVAGTGGWPYVHMLLQDRSEDDNSVCIASIDGWMSPELPAPFLHRNDVQFIEVIPAMLPAFLVGGSYSSLADLSTEFTTAHKSLLGCIRAVTADCDAQKARYTKTLDSVERSVHSGMAGQASIIQSFQSTIAQRVSSLGFWMFFLAAFVCFVFHSLRKSLFSNRLGICGLVTLALFIFGWLPLYQRALNRWGTFAPWNALVYTSSYYRHQAPEINVNLIDGVNNIDLAVDALHGLDPAGVIATEAWKLPFPTAATAGTINGQPIPASSWHAPTDSELFNGPPAGWRPPHRVVVSFTTMPHHVDKLGDTIDSLLAQTMLPDAIYLNLPWGRNRRTNQSYEILPYLQERYGIDGSKTPFKILRCEDVGPLTKLVPTLLEESDPQTMVITVDSDKIYHPSTIATLVWRSFHDPRSAFGTCGWSFYWQPLPMEVVPVYVPWLMRLKQGRAVDVLQACCGNIYRRAHFPDIDLLRNPHKKCFTTDDLWIAAYLAMRSHVQRVLIDTPGQTHSERCMLVRRSRMNDFAFTV